jgi:mannose-6-phosphate isomerase-like protein (cupin superfamily)
VADAPGPAPAVGHRRQRAVDDPVEVRPIHDGDGAIGIRRLFRGQTSTGLNLHVWELPPGTSEGRHTHPAADPTDDWEEVYYVLSGRGVLELAAEDVPLEPDDAVLVPVDVDHGLRCTGDEPLRILLAFARPLR